MQDDLLGLLRREIEKAKPRRFDPDLHPKQPLEHGWLLPYLLLADDFTWKRWSYWHDVMQSRRVIGDTIPRIEWQSNPHARKMLENSLNSITRYGGWQGWGSWNFFSYFMDWLLFGFGHGGHKVLPKEPSGAEGASDRLYQVSGGVVPRRAGVPAPARPGSRPGGVGRAGRRRPAAEPSDGRG
jgi:hypothetical protein